MEGLRTEVQTWRFIEELLALEESNGTAPLNLCLFVRTTEGVS